MMKRITNIILLLVIGMSAQAKSSRTFYTEAKLATMRNNLARHQWARDLQQAHLSEAETWAKRDDAFLRAMVIPPEVPRCYDINNLGCPVHGAEANKRGLYKWEYSLDRPFKIRCPAGGEEYPSNDFNAYLASGMKDRSLLTGDYADDGWGWHNQGEASGYWFVAYYAHWSMQREVQSALRALAMGALVADDPVQAQRFAHKCAVMLWQLATYYPDYQYEKQSREAREHNPNYTGRITNMIWEVGWADVCAPAYDAIWPFLVEDKELQQLAGLDGIGLDQYLRDRLLMTMARDITSGNGRNRGNYGMHQQALIRLALALDEREQSPTSEEMINWVLANPQPQTDSDLGLLDAVLNMVYRDGMPPESPGYNYIWTYGPAEIAALLGDRAEKLVHDPRFRRLMIWHYEVLIGGKFQPPLGDSGDMFARCGDLSTIVGRMVLTHWPDPRVIADLRARSGSDRDLFAEPLDEILARFPEESVPASSASRHLAGYGLGMLQSNAPEMPTTLALHYGSWVHHMHHDQLTLLLFAHDNALLTDIGYPEQTDAFNERRYGIWSNTSAHNTVTVDAHRQGRGPGKLHAYEPYGFAPVVDAECHPYDQCSLFRRSAMLVEAAPGQSYVFDAFYVRGGSQHDFASMGTQADFACEPPLGPVQASGTLAGPDVPYEQYYDDPNLKDKPFGSTSFTGYTGSGFQYFCNVQRAPLSSPMVAEWKLTKPLEGQPARPWEGIGLRAHLVGEEEEVIAADCQPQRYKQMPPWVKYLIRRRTGTDLSSRFVTVFEPYHHHPWIESVSKVSLEPADGEAVAALVTLRSGEKHYCFHSLVPERRYVLDGKLTIVGQAACLVVSAEGDPVRAMLLNGRGLRYGKLRLEGQGLRRSHIATLNYATGEVTLVDPVVGNDLQPGQTILVNPLAGFGSMTVQQVLGPASFSIGDEDLRVGGGPINEILPDSNRIITTAFSPHALTGMAVINSQNKVQGRLAAGERWTLERSGLAPLRVADFPAGDDGLGARFSIVMAAPGDEVVLPNRVLWQAP